MKIGIGNWARPFASVWRVIAFTLVVCATGQAWANLVAEWNGDLDNNSAKGQYTMSRRNVDSSRVTFADGKATLTKHTNDPASQGVVVNLGEFPSKKMSVVVQYSGLDITGNGNTSLLGTTWGDTYEYLAGVNSSGNTHFFGRITSTASASGSYSSSIAPPAKGKMVVVFSGDSSDHPGMDMYYSTYANDSYGAYSQVMYKDGPKVINGIFHNVTIGGSISKIGSYHRPGMVIEAVQIFDSVVTFPATARVTADSTWSALGWDVTLPDPIPAGTITYVVDVPDSAANSVTIDLEGATVNAKSIIFNVAAGKTLTLTGTPTSSGAPIEIAGSGKVVLSSDPGCNIVVASGATLDISASTVSSAITNNGTVNANGCAFTGAVSNSGTLNTSGTVSFSSSASNTSSGTFNVVSGTTTYNSNSQKGISGTLNIAKNATLINGKQDSILWDGTVHVHIRGIVTMNEKWTIGANNYIHLYDGALVNGSALNAFHFNQSSGEGKIISETGSSTITAPFVKGGGTIAKSGSGTLRLENQCLPSIKGSEGTIEVVSTESHSDSKHSHTDSNIPFSGTVKFITSSSPSGQYHMLLWSNSATAGMFANRPALDVSGEVRLYDKIATYALNVRNLCGTGTIRMGGGKSVSGYRYIDTSQTANTVFDGMFTTVSGYAAYDSALTVRGADDATEIYSLTLTGANNTTGPLVIENNAKVIFSSTGKWSGGTVTVKSGGVLESQNSESIAARLVVQEGATLKFANGVQLAATAYDWSAVTNDEAVKLDLSSLTPSATPATLIASGVTVEAGKFKVTSAPCPVDISVVDGALKVAFSNYWSDGAWIDTPVSNKDATLRISQNSTLTVSEALSLGAVTVVKVGDSDVTLTISGTGALTTGGWTIPEGVTVKTPTTMTISGAVSGDGVINVPANTTLAMDGVTCSTKVTIEGTLETSGATTLSAANTSAAGSLIEVVSDVTTLSTKYEGISGDIKIDAPGELKFAASWIGGVDQMWDYLAPNGSTCIKVYGKLTLPNINIWMYPNTSIELYDKAVIEGSGDNATTYGSLMFPYNSAVNVYGNATINAPINTRTGISPTFTIAEGKTLTLSNAFIAQTANPDYAYACGGSLTKAGLGTLSLSGFAMSKPMTINAGKVVVDTVPTASSFAIAEGATFTLNANLDSDVGESQYSGAGTLELENLSGDKSYLQNINFSGIIKTKNAGGNYWIGGADSDGGFAPLFSGTPELIAESGTQLINRNFNADTLPIRDLSGGATITVGNYDSEDDANKTRTVSSKQTKNTTFSGVFASQGTCSTSLEVYGNTSAANLYALTLSGVNTTVGGLTVRDNAKVAFASSGSWANGTVSVNGGGWIESTNTIAMTTLSLADGAGIVVPYVASAAVPLTATTITLPASGTINVDLSAVDVAANEKVTILSATTTLNNADASLFMQTSGNWRFAVEGNTVTATKLGALTWDYTNGWSTDDFSGYTEATINVTGTQEMQLNVSPSIENLTINGSSTPKLTITPSSGNAISAQNVTLGSGVIVYLNGAALNVTGGTIEGGTEIVVNSGATLTLEDVDCASKLNVWGTVVTKGDVDLSVNSVEHVFQTDGTLSVESGATTYLTNRTGYTNGFSGVMDIKSSAKLITKTTGALAYDRDTVRVDVHGTLEFDSGVSWRVGSSNIINLYDGGEIIGTKTDIGNLDLRGAKVYAKGNATIDANVRAYDDTTTTISVDADKTLTIKKVFATDNSTGIITKEGKGTLDLTAITPTKPITINAGTVLAATAPTTAVVNENGVLNLTSTSSKDDRTTNLSGITGSGTIRYSGSSWRALPKTSSNFFADTLSVELEQESGVVCSAQDTVIGSISGGKNLRTDLENYKVNDITIRTVTVKQAKDGTWEGKFTDDRLKTFIVMGGADSTGTLTLTATFTETDEMNVAANGSVKLADTCTWKGDVTVSGEFGGTGSIDGGLTLNAGSKFKVWATGGLTVTGALTLPASGKVTVDVSDLTLSSSGTTLITFTSAPSAEAIASKMAPSSGAFLKLDGSTLKAYPLVATYNGENYATVQAAIDAAEQAGDTYEDVTILDPAATCPNEYYIDNGTLKKKPASITVGENVYYYTTIQAAVADTVAFIFGGTGGHIDYDYLTIYESNTAVAMMDYTLKLATAPGVTGVTVSLPVSFTTTEYAVSSVSGDTYTTYSVSVNPKTYRWKNAAAGTLWTTASNWEFQDNETWTSAQRYPGDGTTGDSVVVAADTSIQLGQSVTLASLQVTGGTLTLTIPSQGTATTLTASEITLGANATISLTGVTLWPVPTTNVSHSRVKTVTVGSTTTYSVELIPGTIFSVW